MDNRNRNNNNSGGFNIVGLIVRILVGALVVAITAFFTPGFSNSGGITSLVIAAIVIGVLEYLVVTFTGLSASPFGKGIAGFNMTAIILYVTGMLVSGLNISIVGALIGALVMGIVEAILPV